jgi:hypothetical protein
MPGEETLKPLESKGTPRLSDFVLYAERSITIGNQSQVLGGDVGVRSLMVQPPKGATPQLLLGKHTKCRNLFSPSASLEVFAEARDVWTDSLTRAHDVTIGAELPFPPRLPPLPLARGTGTSDAHKLAEAPVWFIDLSPSRVCVDGRQVHTLRRYQFGASQELLKTTGHEYCGGAPRSAFQ